MMPDCPYATVLRGSLAMYRRHQWIGIVVLMVNGAIWLWNMGGTLLHAWNQDYGLMLMNWVGVGVATFSIRYTHKSMLRTRDRLITMEIELADHETWCRWPGLPVDD